MVYGLSFNHDSYEHLNKKNLKYKVLVLKVGKRISLLNVPLTHSMTSSEYDYYIM